MYEYIKSESIAVKNTGTIIVTLKAVEAGGNEAVVKDWHAVNDLSVKMSSQLVSGEQSLTATIDTNNHEKLSFGGDFPVGASRVVLTGVLGSNNFAVTYLVSASESGSAAVNAENIILETLCVPEDGGVQTFGGQAGKITLGEHLSMTGKRLDVEYPQPYVHYDIVADMEGEGVTDLTTALAAMNGKTLVEVFGEDATIADLNAEFDSAKSLIVLDGLKGYVFSRLNTEYDEQNGDTNTYIYNDGTDTHTVVIAPTGVTAA